ncbi:GNAT family N-acetyltransferase [Mesobacterium pallidum]|uniref:GNAT family N-acetyltransferase n=1 Tax=Mesobacterium pallidum TaxID=2872037 RepID=UPI001EE2C546|nr:GNAT family N-acetyltransferase [Mesobacterium pallidum]
MIIRRAGAMDARPMTELLNEIIAIGGTTAYINPRRPAELQAQMAEPGAIWHLAEAEDGTLLGFQWIAPHPAYGPDVANIATFARAGRTGLGIGSALFEATKEAARTAGFAWINAEIRADNAGGLIYYQSRGFEDHGRITGYVMEDGTSVDKILKRYDL